MENKTETVRIEDLSTDQLLAELNRRGWFVCAIRSASVTALKIGMRYFRRGLLVSAFIPSNLDVNSDWQFAHFGSSASDYTQLFEHVLIADNGDMQVCAVEPKYNKAIDGMTLAEVQAFLSAEYGYQVELLPIGKIRQNKGHTQAIINRIIDELNKWEIENRA